MAWELPIKCTMLKSLAALVLRRYRSFDANFKNFNCLSDITKVMSLPITKPSKYIKPCQINYVENGQQKKRDMIKVHDGVLVVLYNVSRQKLIYVRQFRPAVYHGIVTGNSREISKGEIDLTKFPTDLGVTIEPCAGLVDKDLSLQEIAREEVYEECGYDVPADSFQFIYEYRSGVSSSSCAQTLFYCEVSDEQKVSEGGGVNDEVIQVVELTIDDARKMVTTGSKINAGPTTVISTLWFLANKA